MNKPLFVSFTDACETAAIIMCYKDKLYNSMIVLRLEKKNYERQRLHSLYIHSTDLEYFLFFVLKILLFCD